MLFLYPLVLAIVYSLIHKAHFEVECMRFILLSELERPPPVAVLTSQNRTLWWKVLCSFFVISHNEKIE